jgi:hypothetical protein
MRTKGDRRWIVHHARDRNESDGRQHGRRLAPLRIPPWAWLFLAAQTLVLIVAGPRMLLEVVYRMCADARTNVPGGVRSAPLSVMRSGTAIS